MRRWGFALMTPLLIACESPSGFESVINQAKSSNFKGGDRLECEVDTVDYLLDTKVLGYQIVSSGGLNFGFNLLENFFSLFGVSFRMRRGEMRLTMDLSEARRPSYYVANVQGRATLSGNAFNAQINAGQFRLGAEYYYQTPLARLSENGLKDGLKNAVEQMRRNPLPWSTMVYRMPSPLEVVLPVGSVAGLRAGDKVGVYPTQHLWTGTPCASEYIIGRKITTRPSHVGEVVAVENNAALVWLPENIDGPTLQEGDIVEAVELIDARNRPPLSRSVRIRNVESEKITFEDGTEVDLVKYLKEQIRSVMKDYNLYVAP